MTRRTGCAAAALAALLGILGGAQAAYYDNYGAAPDSNWSSPATWRWEDFGSPPPPSNGPGENDEAYVYNSVVYDLGASGSIINFSQDPGCTVTLRQNLTATGAFNSGGIVDMNGHAITAASFGISGSLVNKGALISGDCINLGGGATVILDGNDRIATGGYAYSGTTLGLGSVGGNVGFVVADDGGTVTAAPGYVTPSSFFFDVRSNGTLRVAQGAGETTGVTYGPEDTVWQGLHQRVNSGGVVQLVFDAGSAAGDWIFKTNADSVSDLEGMVTDLRLVISGAAYEIINDGTWTIVRATGSAPSNHPGDANGDGVVDLQDFGSLKDSFGATTGATWAMGDFNADGAIDLQDFGILKDHFGHTNGDSPVTAVPEPASMGLLALAGLGLRRRR